MNIRGIFILTAAFIFALFTAAPGLCADEQTSAEQELERIEMELEKTKARAAETAKKEKNVLGDIERIDKSLAKKRAEVTKLKGSLGEVEAEIGRTGAGIEDTRARLKAKQKDLAGRLRAMYKTDRAGGPWVVLVSGDYASMLKRYKYLSVMSEKDRRLMDGYSKDLDKLKRQEDELRLRQEKYGRLSRQKDEEAARAAAEEQEKKKLLASIRKKKGSYEAMAKELEEAGQRMKELIRRLEEEALAERGVPSELPSLSKGLDWPIDGKLIGRFGKQKHPEYDTYIYKKGIELQAAMGSRIKAVEAAEVVFANWFKGLGLVTILRHGGNYYTVYAHLAELKVARGDKVARGQVIATLGDTGTQESPSLYFEVRKGSDAMDPLDWLKKR